MIAYGKQYKAKLLDLPTMIECQRTNDRHRFVKVCDISQILVVQDPDPTRLQPPTHPDPFSDACHDDQYPHGITPPMYKARQRRFNPRLGRRGMTRLTVEQMEQELQRLLMEDQRPEVVSVDWEWKEDVVEKEDGMAVVEEEALWIDEDMDATLGMEEALEEAFLQQEQQNQEEEESSEEEEDEEEEEEEEEEEKEEQQQGVGKDASGSTSRHDTVDRETLIQIQRLSDDIEALRKSMDERREYVATVKNKLIQDRVYKDIILMEDKFLTKQRELAVLKRKQNPTGNEVSLNGFEVEHRGLDEFIPQPDLNADIQLDLDVQRVTGQYQEYREEEQDNVNDDDDDLFGEEEDGGYHEEEEEEDYRYDDEEGYGELNDMEEIQDVADDFEAVLQ